jgi:HKD family nuclease
MKTYKDVYQLPLRMQKYGSWVYDANNNFVFEFEIENKEKQQLLLDVINGEKKLYNPDAVFHHKDGYIFTDKGVEVILIRGWGNLTGTGAMNLSSEEAANIQDTFAEFIVEQLNKRDVVQ